MILAALGLAAVLDASPAVQTPLAPPAPVVHRSLAPSAPFALPPIAERTPNLYREAPGCKDAPYRVVDRFGRPVARKLGDLPAAAVILAVERTIGGCQVVTVAYGAVNPDQPNPPPQAYRAEPLTKPLLKRGDAPSNRR
jgi:hypothetical protein